LKALKSFSVYTFGSILQTAVSFLLLPVYIKYLTPDEYGVISVILVMSSIFIIFTDLGAASGFYRLYYEGQKEKLFTTVLIWRLLTAFLALIFITCFSRDISIMLFKEDTYKLAVLFAGLFVFFSPLKELFFLTLRLEQLSKKFVSYSLFYAIIDFALKLIYIVLLKKGVLGYWIAQVISELVLIVVIFFYSKVFNIFKKPNFLLLGHVLKVGFPYTFSTIGAWVVDASDKLLLNFFIGPAAVGIYTIAIKISSIFKVILDTPVGLWWTPLALEKASKEGIEPFKKVTKEFLNITSVSGFLAIPIISLVGLIVAFLPGHQEYKEAIILVPFCLIPPFIYLIMHPFATQFIQAKKTKYAGWGGIAAIGVNVGLNFLLIPAIGVWGAIVSSVAAYSFWLAIYYFGGQKSLYIRYEWVKVAKNFLLFLIYEAILLVIIFLKKSFYIPILAIGSVIAILILVIINYNLIIPFAIEFKNIIKNYTSQFVKNLKKLHK